MSLGFGYLEGSSIVFGYENVARYEASLTVIARSGGRERIAEGSEVINNTGATNFGGGCLGGIILPILSNPLMRL